MDLGLSGRVALVVGGTAGLGLAIGRALAAEGAVVALAGRRREIAEREASMLPGAIGVSLDIESPASIDSAIDVVRSELGEIDILLVNGGGPPAGDVLSFDEAALRRAGELLLYGPYRLVSACLPSMRERGWGRIIAIGSTSVRQPITGLAASSIYRIAAASYYKLLAEQVAVDGITVNMIHPGRIATDRTAQIDQLHASSSGATVEEVQANSQRLIPVGRYGTPEEFASAALYLCSDASRYITGEQLRVDGGLVRSL
jgi:3-oxoacyl-[acyl-carrier protein] reductase